MIFPISDILRKGLGGMIKSMLIPVNGDEDKEGKGDSVTLW
jgi:hypothetical protein